MKHKNLLWDIGLILAFAIYIGLGIYACLHPEKYRGNRWTAELEAQKHPPQWMLNLDKWLRK